LSLVLCAMFETRFRLFEVSQGSLYILYQVGYASGTSFVDSFVEGEARRWIYVMCFPFGKSRV